MRKEVPAGRTEEIDASRAGSEEELDREVCWILGFNDVNPNGPDEWRHLAYVIYTSGHDWTPERRDDSASYWLVRNLFHALDPAIDRSESRPMRVGVNASLTFDASVNRDPVISGAHALPHSLKRLELIVKN